MYLLDTHALIWYLFDDDNLSSRAKNIINNETCYYTMVSLWEIAIKQTRDLIKYKYSIMDIIAACEQMEFSELLISGGSLERIKSLPNIHKDPFDRLLITMAQESNLTIITKDTLITQYDVKTIW